MSLAESPFCCPCFHCLSSMSAALLFLPYWFIDRLLSCVVFTTVDHSHGFLLRFLCLVFGVPFFLLLFLLSLPLGLFGFLFWAPLQRARRPFAYQRTLKDQDLPKLTRGTECPFIFISANLCLLPDGLARFSNLSHTQRRTRAISRSLCCSPESTEQNGKDTQPVCRTEDVMPMIRMPRKAEEDSRAEDDVHFEVSMCFPRNADFVCLQEVFDARASSKLRRCLRPFFPHILYDVGPSGPHSCGFKFFNSGLFLASRHPFAAVEYYFYPNARGEDALASKGLLCAKVHIGVTENMQRIVGFINCTHLHAPESDAEVRCDQMSMLLSWISDFQTKHREDGEVIAFDVLCGDLNFDNCSSDDCLEQKHKLFSVYRDPCRDCAGRDRLGTMGTLLRADSLYHEAVNTPANLKRTLESETDRRLYIAPPLPEGTDETGAHWTGRRIDYILYKESSSLLPLWPETTPKH
ncbi:sphingomyelin phosphodiesterase 5-like isoform X2 [Hyperolius riggenbachi]|uniref:sphingomyelin phosphodiesterase 5-like isoform X2 n=1 Tax=Hyperolius riggenbachi TaxID=752182 RepID=UPI0035A2DE9F